MEYFDITVSKGVSMKKALCIAIVCFLLPQTGLGMDICIKGGLSGWGYIHNYYSTEVYPAEQDSTGTYEKIPDSDAVSKDFDSGDGYTIIPPAYAFFLEVSKPLSSRGAFQNVMAGGGVGYISDPVIDLPAGETNKLGNSETWGFATIPAYFFTKYTVPVHHLLVPYAVLKGGINVPLQQSHTDLDEVDPGIYAAAGVGCEISLVQIELVYSLATVHIPDYSRETTYTEENSSGETEESIGIREGNDNYIYNQIMLCAGIRFDI